MSEETSTQEFGAEFEAEFDSEPEAEEEFDTVTDAEEAEEDLQETAETEEPEEAMQEPPEAITVGGRTYTMDALERALQPPEGYDLLMRLADESGLGVQEYLNAIEQQSNEQSMAARVAQLMEEGAEEEFARQMAGLEAENARLTRQKQAATQNEQRQSAQEERIQKNIEEFAARYPDVTQLPQEVLSDIASTGATPLQAYQSYLLTQQEKELARLRQKEKNRNTSMGSARGQGQAQDEFLGEFLK